MGISIILPAFNEAENLVVLLPEILETVQALGFETEVIVVDDGSRDGTATVLAPFAGNPEVKTVVHPVNRGYGAALRSGFATATQEWIFFMDADRQFDIREIRLLTDRSDEADFIIGYRKERSDHAMRSVNAAVFGLAVRLLFGIRVRDLDCAFKLMRRSVLQSLELESDGALISTELLYKAKKAGASWIEIPVTHYPRRSGSSTGANLRVILRAVKELLLFRLTGRIRPRPAAFPAPKTDTATDH